MVIVLEDWPRSVLLLLCVIMVLSGGHGTIPRRAYAMSRWPTVVGRITSSWKVLEGERIRYAVLSQLKAICDLNAHHPHVAPDSAFSVNLR